MRDSYDTEICYLLAFPDASMEPAEPAAPIGGLKDAPYFQPVDIRVQSLAEAVPLAVEETQVSVTRQRFEERIQVVECHFSLGNVLSVTGAQHCESVQNALTRHFVPEVHQASGMYEQYVILLVCGLRIRPDDFLDRNAAAVARFIRSQRESFDRQQLDEILSSRVRYSEHELTVVDWEGAVVVSSEGDFRSDIELMKIGNYQLLCYRLLDRNLESSLEAISRQFRADPRRFRPGPTRGQIRRIIQHRLDIMLDFEHTEQNLLLIGDWYTAQLYHAIRQEFYLEEWKQAVKDKLENLENIVRSIQENFSLTWTALLERVELIGWVILLIGYFILFFMEAMASRP